jgi:hypothetical protein
MNREICKRCHEEGNMRIWEGSEVASRWYCCKVIRYVVREFIGIDEYPDVKVKCHYYLEQKLSEQS